MPTFRVDIFEGRPASQKKELAEAITRESCRVLGCDPSAVDVIFNDIKKQDWATAGKMWSEQD